jgi:hypothetical protein
MHGMVCVGALRLSHNTSIVQLPLVSLLQTNKQMKSTHIPVMVKEVLEVFSSSISKITPKVANPLFVDAT